MKKIVVLVFMLCIASTAVFAENHAGADKIGVYLGFPNIGLSYSHNFTKEAQLDLVAAVHFIPTDAGLGLGVSADLGFLYSVWEPNVGGVGCPLELGGGIGIAPWWAPTNKYGAIGGINFKIFGDIRWEVFFRSLPKFNLFLDFAPGVYLGVYHFDKNHWGGFSYRGGLGLRYQID